MSPDLLYGGTGDDWIRAGWGDTVVGGAGSDTLQVEFMRATAAVIADFSVLTAGRAITIGGVTLNGIEWLDDDNYLSRFDDHVVMGATPPGTSVSMNGYGGNGTISGGSGRDVLIGSTGDDALTGKGGDDSLRGGYDDDVLEGGDGADPLVGGAGRDVLDGGDGADLLGAGYEEYDWSQYAIDYRYWVDDIDWDADVLCGGDGDDKIYVGAGDAADGGAGVDVLHVDYRDSAVAIVANFAKLTAGSAVLIAGVEYAGIEQIARFNEVNYDYNYAGVMLSRFDDRMIAGAWTPGIDRAEIDSGDGNDVIVGGVADERIDGEGGLDRLIGGDGNDLLYDGSGADALRGDAGDDDISGGAGDDRLQGGDGDDELYGSDGIDRIDGGTGIDELVGGNGDDVLHGGEGADLLDGGSGTDRLDGGDGADMLDGGSGADRLDGGGGDDVLSVAALAGDGETLIGGAGADRFVIAVAPVWRYGTVPMLRIMDFARDEGDVIDVGSAAQDFAFMWTEAFHRVPNEVRYEARDGRTVIQFDADGNGRADLTIRLVHEIALVASDFAL